MCVAKLRISSELFSVIVALRKLLSNKGKYYLLPCIMNNVLDYKMYIKQFAQRRIYNEYQTPHTHLKTGISYASVQNIIKCLCHVRLSTCIFTRHFTLHNKYEFNYSSNDVTVRFF